MSIKIAGGVKQDGIVVGNAYDKYGSTNPLVRAMMAGFEQTLASLVSAAAPTSVHEVGCGEGHWVLRLHEQGMAARGSDFSSTVIDLARANAAARGLPPTLFSSRSIYALDPASDSADLVICCEVLEHLDDPVRGLQVLQQVVGRHLIVSVPREPLWRVLNLARGKYVRDLGNTPGHLQHWSKSAFIELVEKYFHIIKVQNPFPWTMLLCEPHTKKSHLC